MDIRSYFGDSSSSIEATNEATISVTNASDSEPEPDSSSEPETRLRNSLNEGSLSHLMKIAIESPEKLAI